jgi:hypothetical protein
VFEALASAASHALTQILREAGPIVLRRRFLLPCLLLKAALIDLIHLVLRTIEWRLAGLLQTCQPHDPPGMSPNARCESLHPLDVLPRESQSRRWEAAVEVSMRLLSRIIHHQRYISLDWLVGSLSCFLLISNS